MARCLIALLPAYALACSWGATTIKISPLNHGWSFCCPGLDGTKAHQATVKYNSVNNDAYSVRPGISSTQLSEYARAACACCCVCVCRGTDTHPSRVCVCAAASVRTTSTSGTRKTFTPTTLSIRPLGSTGRRITRRRRSRWSSGAITRSPPARSRSMASPSEKTRHESWRERRMCGRRQFESRACESERRGGGRRGRRRRRVMGGLQREQAHRGGQAERLPWREAWPTRDCVGVSLIFPHPCSLACTVPQRETSDRLRRDACNVTHGDGGEAEIDMYRRLSKP